MSIFPITNKLNLLCKERNCVVSHQECSLTSSGHSASVQWSSSSVSNLVCLPGLLCFANKSLKWTRSWLHRFASRVSAFFFFFSKSKGIKIYKKLLASKFTSIGKFGAISLTVFPFLLRPSDDACWERLQRPHCFPSHHKYWLARVGEISHQWPKKKQLFNLDRLRESREYF